MNTLNISAQDLKQINKIKKYFLTDKNATTSSHTRFYKELETLSKKYNTTTQTIYDSATI